MRKCRKKPLYRKCRLPAWVVNYPVGAVPPLGAAGAAASQGAAARAPPVVVASTGVAPLPMRYHYGIAAAHEALAPQAPLTAFGRQQTPAPVRFHYRDPAARLPAGVPGEGKFRDRMRVMAQGRVSRCQLPLQIPAVS